MSNTLLGLRTAIYNFKTTDMPAARAWYAKAFGIDPYFDQPFYIGFNIAGFELGLHPNDDIPASREGSVSTYWGVADIETTFAHLLSLGAVEHAGIQDVGGGIKVATVLDPFGNPFGLIENSHFGQ